MTFTYDATQLADKSLNQMRFELGDVFVEEPSKTCYLSYETILAALASSRTFKRAEFKLIESLVRRFSYEVNTKIDSLDLKLHQRLEAWQSEYKRLKAELDAEDISSSAVFARNRNARPSAFWLGQHDWRLPCT